MKEAAAQQERRAVASRLAGLGSHVAGGVGVLVLLSQMYPETHLVFLLTCLRAKRTIRAT
jgi:hypothetical protein